MKFSKVKKKFKCKNNYNIKYNKAFIGLPSIYNEKTIKSIMTVQQQMKVNNQI